MLMTKRNFKGFKTHDMTQLVWTALELIVKVIQILWNCYSSFLGSFETKNVLAEILTLRVKRIYSNCLSDFYLKLPVFIFLYIDKLVGSEFQIHHLKPLVITCNVYLCMCKSALEKIKASCAVEDFRSLVQMRIQMSFAHYVTLECDYLPHTASVKYQFPNCAYIK